jgi:hypothetical protein
MDGLGGFLFLLILGVVFLLQHFFQNASKSESRVEKPAQMPGEEQPKSDAAEVVSSEPHPRRTKPRFASRAEHTPVMRSPEPSTAARVSARDLLAGRANLRRAVIVMTVLGPPVSERPEPTLP